MDKEFSDFIFRQNKFLDYDKFQDFNVSLHGPFEDYNGHLYSKMRFTIMTIPILNIIYG